MRMSPYRCFPRVEEGEAGRDWKGMRRVGDKSSGLIGGGVEVDNMDGLLWRQGGG